MTSSFISRAACNGRRPLLLADNKGMRRSTLVSRLLKERDVARFVIAPAGYGKTSLALDYAETIFNWIHVFWISAQSPCFIRDLDKNSIASGCLAFDEEAALVVFDDLPVLDPSRMERFSKEIDTFLENGCEVLVVCRPSCDISGVYQQDRICLKARELLLDDEELDVARSTEEQLRKPADSVLDICRVPVLVWEKDDENRNLFIRNSLQEELPAEFLLLMGSILILQKGTFECLRELTDSNQETFLKFAENYPHLGLDRQTESFESSAIDIDPIIHALKGKMDQLVASSTFSSRDQLINFWAFTLLKNNLSNRACDVVRLLNSRKRTADWVIENSQELIRQSCFYPMYLIVQRQKNLSNLVKSRLSVLHAFCLRVLGDKDEALKIAQRWAYDASATEDVQICSLLILAHVGKGAVAARAEEALLAMKNTDKDEQERSQDFCWQLMLLWCARHQGVQNIVALWEKMVAQEVCDDVLFIGASWIFGLLGYEETSSDIIGTEAFPRKIEQFVRESLASKADGRSTDYYVASAVLSMEEAHGRGTVYNNGPIEATILLSLRQIEMSILSQRGQFEQSVHAEQIKRMDWVNSKAGAAYSQGKIASVASRRRIPILSLRLFGCFQVMIGDEVVDPRYFRRQNARALLVLLAANLGKEVSKEQLAHAMWPTSSTEVARKNFYTVWAQLRKSLSLSDGTCPYLLRHQYGCSLDGRYVQSDVERLAEICRELLFGKPDVDRWSLLFAEIDRDFSCDLMPSETRNQLVIKTRWRKVDGGSDSPV